jgi:two-component system OmpR family response regulator
MMRILVVEDDTKIASFIGKGLKQAGHVVDCAPDGAKGLQVALERQFDAIIIDLMLPKLDGYNVIRELRAQGRTTPILILSAKSATDDKLAGFSAGTDDYLTKPFSFAELLARLQALVRRGSQAPAPAELTAGDLAINLMTRKVTRNGREIDLPPREYALLEYLARNAGNVVSKTMIMEQIWAYYFDPETNIVDVLVHRLRAKVDGGCEKKLIHTVRGVGYVLKIV